MSKIPATILAAPFWIVGTILGALGLLALILGGVFALAGHMIQEAGNDKKA